MLINFVTQWLLPPKFTALLRRLKPIKQETYKNFDEALQASSGYENSKLIQVIKEKSLNYIEILNGKEFPELPAYKILLLSIIMKVLIESDKKAMTILDVGGQFGATFYEARRHLGEKIDFEWYVLETPKIIENCLSFENDELQFVSSFEEIHKHEFDLVIASNAIQYFPNPHDIIEKIFNLNSNYIYFTRFPVINNLVRDTVMIQYSNLYDNGPGAIRDALYEQISYPVNLLAGRNISSFLNSFQKYEKIIQINENGVMYRLNDNKIRGTSLLFRIFIEYGLKK